MRLTLPGSLLPLYSSNTDVCTFMQFAAIVVLGDTWKEQQDFAEPHCVHSQLIGGQGCSRRSYKNPVLAIGLSHFFDANGQHSTRCSPGNRLCPIWRDEYSLRWPSDRTELISSSVSRRLLIWNNAYYAFYVNYAIYSNNAGVYQYKQKYRGQCQFPFSYQHQLLPECSCLLLQVA